jgi:hypothetical protein
MRRLSGAVEYFYAKQDALLREAENDYLELQLTGDHLVTQPANLLAPFYPRILTITQTAALRMLNEAQRKNSLLIRSAQDAGAGDIERDFAAFLEDLYGDSGEDGGAASAEAEKKRLFNEIRREIEAEAGAQ